MGAALGHAGDGRRGRSPTYNSWRAMIERCTYAAHPRYADYGGRGIRVYAGWVGRGGFAAFLAHVGERPAGMTLDRIDVEKDYRPGNVRWATQVEQRWNRRDMAAGTRTWDGDQLALAPATQPAGMPF